MAGSPYSQDGMISGINVTPLVDIVLVLLLVFMLTAKLTTTSAVPLNLPRASQGEEVQTILAVSLTQDGELFIDGEPASPTALRARAEAALAQDEELRVVIQADGDVRHRQVIGVLDSLKAVGVERVAFATVAPEASAPTVTPSE